jgi:peptidyl-prolyl cis-trans isomerase D
LGTKVPDTMRELVLRFQGDTRTIDYITLTPFSIDPVAAPTDEELTAYLTENQANYRSIETRTISGLVLTPESLAASIEVTDEDARARYDQNAASYQRPATRTIQILGLPAEATVAWFNRGLLANRPFEAVAEEAGLTAQIVDLGTMTEEQVPDPAVADVAFRLQAGQYAVLTGDSDPLAIHISAADDGGQQPYEAVADQVKSEVALSRARDQIAEITDQIEELRAALQPIGDIVSRFGLSATTATIDQAGGGLEAFTALPEDARAQVASAVFAADPERLIPSVPLGANRTLWFDVTGTDPARDLTLEEARAQLTTDWTDARTFEAMQARAEELVARIEAGENISDIAIEIGALAEVSAPIGRNGDGLSISAQVAQATFNGGIGYSGSVATPEGDFVVFTVNDIQAADPAIAPAELDTSLQDSIAQTVYGQFIARLVEQAGLIINEVALNDLLINGLTAQ